MLYSCIHMAVVDVNWLMSIFVARRQAKNPVLLAAEASKNCRAVWYSDTTAVTVSIRSSVHGWTYVQISCPNTLTQPIPANSPSDPIQPDPWLDPRYVHF